MKIQIFPTLIVMCMAGLVYLLPAGSLAEWQLKIYGKIASLFKYENNEIHDREFDLELKQIIWQKNAEIADLRQQLNNLQAAKEIVHLDNIVNAKIINIPGYDNINKVVIDCGENENIKPGDAVVVANALAGVVAKVSDKAALVFTLLSSDIYISARLNKNIVDNNNYENEKDLCAVKTKNKKIKALFFSEKTKVKQGDIISTSGLEKGIPEGLIIGVVNSDLAETAEFGVWEVEVEPIVDFYKLNNVVVLREEKIEREF